MQVSVAPSQPHRVACFGDPQHGRKRSEALVNKDSQELMKTKLLLSKYVNKIQMHCSILFDDVPEAWFSPHNAVLQLLEQMDVVILCGYLPNMYLIIREACVSLVPLLGDGRQGYMETGFAGGWWPETEGQPCAKCWLDLLRISFRGWAQRPMRLQTQSNFFCIHGYCKCDVLIWGHAGKGRKNLALQKWFLGYLLFVTNPGKMINIS